MTLNELISEIEVYRPDLERRYITHLININRALLLKNRLNQRVNINDVVKQTLLDVDLEIVDNSELAGFPSDSRLLRTTKQIPSLIASKNAHGFLAVRSPLIVSEEFNVVPVEDLLYKGNGRYNQRKVFCALYNGYLYIKLNRTNPKIALITKLSIEGLFEDPLDVIKFNEPDTLGRDFWFKEYPINSADWVYIRNLILGVDNEEANQN